VTDCESEDGDCDEVILARCNHSTCKRVLNLLEATFFDTLEHCSTESYRGEV